MANPYVDTTLIECNRLQSTQQAQVDKIESNAIFTNRQSNTIIVEQGDTISVQSAFINQKGCNIPTSLEFKGKYLTDVKLEKTEGLIKKNGNLDQMGRVTHVNLPEDNSQITVGVFDNKATLEVNYYKNSNGEQYCFLPRCFLTPTQQTISNADSAKIWPLWLNSNSTTDNGKNNGEESGIVFYSNLYDTTKTIINFNDYHSVFDVDTTANPNTVKNLLKPKNDNSKYTLMTRCYTWTQNSELDFIAETIDGVDYENDGLQFMKYAWDEALATPVNPATKRLMPKFLNNYFDPALSYYVKQTDHVDISVERGFNSAQSVAQQITEDLQKYISDEEAGTFWPSGTGNAGVFSATTTSLLRPRHCANPQIFSKEYFDEMAKKTDAQKSLDYYNCYRHILVKRPDLFIIGRKCNNRFGEVPNVIADPTAPANKPRELKPTIENTDPGMTGLTTPNFNRNVINFDVNAGNVETNTTTELQTSWLWSITNLEALRDLFIEQGKYPDLFKCDNVASDYLLDANAEYVNYNYDGAKVEFGETATIDNSRFLHMTRINYGNDYGWLGSDNYIDYSAKPDADNIGTTAPVFFKFEPGKVNVYTDGGSTSDLCFGFATKTIDPTSKKEYITLHPELVNGFREDMFNIRKGKNGKDNIGVNKALIGWDYHFNSYGNVVMMPQTGLLNQTPNTEWSTSINSNNTDYLPTVDNRIDLNSKYNQMYLGSNNTACVYDQISNKFGWEYLHIPENVGQLYNSGESEVINKVVAGSTRLPLVDDAKNEVYKINKRLQYYSYCPDMVPYRNAIDGDVKTGTSSLSNGGSTFASSGALEFSLFNTNLEPWTVFDAHTGVNLNFGKSCDRLNWDKSLLGILGHTYEQFNPEVINQENNGTQARLTFNNLKEMYNPTTNSEVVSSDIIDYNITPFGGTQYYPMPAFMVSVNGFAYNGTPKDLKGVNYYPAIAEATQSIILEATNLPKTVLNPYLNIRSDIINESKYFGGLNSGLNYPICAVVNKINADKDFIQLDNSDIIFTCKKKMAISSITTVITDPDGSLALVDEGSSVIYKIQRQKNGKDLNIIAQVLEQDKQKK